MRIFLTVAALLLLHSVDALAGSGYDRCIREQNALKTEENSACNGMRYLFNPSACFATQRALREYTSTGKCKKIGRAENVDFGVPAAPAVPQVPAATPVPAAKTAASVNPAAAIQSSSETPQPETTCEQLKDENARLKAEVSRLTAENEQFRKTGR